MRFELSEEQQALQRLVRDVFAKLYPTTRLRELWDGGDPDPDPDAWRTMAEVGVLGVLVPEHLGGLGGDAVDLAVLLEEAGRAAVPEPLLESGVFAAVVAEAGTEEQRRRWLAALASGEARASVRLSGQRFVADADRADVLLADRQGGPAVVEAGGFTWERVAVEDQTRRLFTVQVDAGALQPLGASDRGTAGDLAAVGAAALLVGVAGYLLDTSVAHAGTREQFGRPIGAFQAPKHALASVFTMLESARAATRYAAYALAHRLPDRDVAVSAAFVQAVEAEALANTTALQCHGGIGFTWDHPLHWWLKRGRALEHAYASAADHRLRLAEALFDDVEETT